MLSREDALNLVSTHVAKENNVKHMVAVGAVMREVALRLGQDAQLWEMIGILHDVDFEVCSGPADHTIKARDMLKGIVSDDVIEVIMAHNHENTGVQVDTLVKKALIASDAASGLVLACALVMPSKKLADVRPESLLKKFKSKDFAKGVSRERIAMCSELGLTLDEFLALGLEGMKKVSEELGL
jgi:predicted hydrolase (HD superfamily)